MNKWVLMGIAFVCGGLGGYLLGKYQGLIEGENKAWDEFGCEHCELNHFDKDPEGDFEKSEESEDFKKAHDHAENQVAAPIAHRERIEYLANGNNKAFAQKNTIDEIVKENVSDLYEMAMEGDPFDGIREITADEWHDDQDFDKEVYLYYEADDVLTDQDNEVVYDKWKYTGDCLDGLGEYRNADSVFIRNINKNTDY